MRPISNDRLKVHFLGWQCRIRQFAAREYGGQPMPAMQPHVSNRKGEVMLAAMRVLLIPLDPSASTAFFRFQVLRTNEVRRAREAGIGYLAGEFYQEPELFSDEMTAVFDAGSKTATRLLKFTIVLLDFQQYSQSFRMFCRVRRMPTASQAREASLWQSRLFNPNVPNDALVLSFKPDWKSAAADPMP